MFLRVNRRKKRLFTSCGGLRVLAAQELLSPLLARALFLGCTAPFRIRRIWSSRLWCLSLAAEAQKKKRTIRYLLYPTFKK